MSKKAFKTRGVYIEEVSCFPAFIGYTPQAMHNGTDCAFVPTKISSFLEFQRIFCFPDGSEPVQQYSPHYYLVRQNSKPSTGDFILIGSDYYSIHPDAFSIYYMYNSVKLFYQNGGEESYIVSIGG